MGDLNARTSLLRIVEAFAKIAGRIDQDLLFVGPHGPEEYLSRVRKRVCSLSLTNRVLFAGRVSDERLASMYDACTALACCSRYEGFGYPIAEAPSRAVPIIASLPEIAGSAAVYVDPNSTDSIADALLRVATDAPLETVLSAAGPREARRFTVEAPGISAMSVYAELAA